MDGSDRYEPALTNEASRETVVPGVHRLFDGSAEENLEDRCYRLYTTAVYPHSRSVETGHGDEAPNPLPSAGR